jgi:hypothetical protein
MARKKRKPKAKASRAKAARGKKSSRRKEPTRGGGKGPGARARIHQGVALGKPGQSGDLQGLSTIEDVDSESVAELAEEGQGFEAGIVAGVENAPDAEEGEVHTAEVPEDDVPSEYRGYREREE